MKPIKLVMRAFGPYAGEQELDFACLRGRSFFLIHGATGAGKTSILDAMCFALYGVTSGGSREARQMRSDHAEQSVLTEVQFDFAIGGEQYRIWRAPEQSRPRKRGGEGMVRQDPQATLSKRRSNGDGEHWAPLATGWSDVTEAVVGLMGFQAAQFRQVVMLPQGMFQQLLTSNSQERATILETLFQVESYGKIEQALKESAAGLRRQMEQGRLKWGETLRPFGVEKNEELGQRLEEARGQLEQVRQAAGPLRERKEKAGQDLAAGRRTAERIAERELAERLVKQLQARAGEMALKQSAYERASKAARLVEAEAALNQRRKEAEAGQRKLSGAETMLKQAGEARTKAEAALTAEQGREDSRQRGRRRLEELEQLEGKLAELEEARRQWQAAQRAEKEAQEERGRVEASRQKVAEQLRLAEGRRQACEAISCRLAELELKRKNAEESLARRRALEELGKALALAEAQERKVREHLTKAQAQQESAKGKYEQLQRLWNSGQAAILAQGLVVGEACPVCGSTHHPAPAHGGEKLPRQQEVEEARRQAESLEKSLKALREELAGQQQAVAEKRGAVGQLRQALGMQVGMETGRLEEVLAELEKQLAEAQGAALELTGVQRRIEGLKQQEVSVGQQLAAAEARVVTAGGEAQVKGAVVAERQGQLPEALASTAALEKEKAKVARTYQQLVEALEMAQRQAAEAAMNLARAEATWREAREQQQASAETARQQAAEFEKKVSELGFADVEAYRAARLSEGQIAALDGEMREYHLALHAAQERWQRATEAAAGLATPDVAQLQRLAAEAESGLEQNTRQEAELAMRVGQLAAALEWVTELERQLAALEERYTVVGQIANVANGQNEYKMTFQRYVLGVFLDQVMEAATQRLRVMTRHRFQLQRIKDPATGKTRVGGLDMEIHDTWTSTSRPVSTLSGGECFQASLALALGLADVVQSHAGGIRLETIFVDEGFGSLDPEALDSAMQALKDLQQGGRLVGIISHVGELKEQIDARLEVTGGRGGATARFVVG